MFTPGQGSFDKSHWESQKPTLPSTNRTALQLQLESAHQSVYIFDRQIDSNCSFFCQVIISLSKERDQGDHPEGGEMKEQP